MTDQMGETTVTSHPPRQAEPGQAFTWHDQANERHEYQADDAGVLAIPDAEAELMAIAFGLPVIGGTVSIDVTDLAQAGLEVAAAAQPDPAPVADPPAEPDQAPAGAPTDQPQEA